MPAGRVLVAAVIAVAVVAAAIPALHSTSAQGATASCTLGAGWPGANVSLAQQVVALVNQHRASLGLAGLQNDQALTDSAAWKASHMANYGYFDHNDPAPPVARDPFTRMTDCGYSAGGAEGENIAFGQADANDVMNAWLNSPGHKANIEQPSFRSIGVGAATAANGQIYWVQDFAGGVSSGAPPASAPPPAPAPPAPAPPPAAAPAAPAAPPAAPKPPASPAAPISSPGSPSSGSSPAETPSGAAAATTEGIGSALLPVSKHVTIRDARRHKARSTRLVVAKPHAGQDYAVRMAFGPVRVATENLAVRCRAKLAGKRMRGKGEIGDHVATCTWAIPAGADGKRLKLTVKVTGHHGISLVRHAKLIVGD
jgi:uncharacterized protein YkwD